MFANFLGVSNLIDGKLGRSEGGLAHVQTGRIIEGMALLDEDLLRFETVWAAAGHPHAMLATATR